MSVNRDLSRGEPFPEPRPVPDPRLNTQDLLDAGFGPVNPHTGDRDPSPICRSIKCKLIVGGGIGLVLLGTAANAEAMSMASKK
ncbi:MAG: hypothetical protein Q8N51_07170 [Gammaproteobacteria bacterium]|nr:hypothetical protein [Gammaproteobacteria bacterium]